MLSTLTPMNWMRLIVLKTKETPKHDHLKPYRGLIDTARFSYVVGQRNDKFDLTTIILAAGTHTVDNVSGFIPVNVSEKQDIQQDLERPTRY